MKHQETLVVGGVDAHADSHHAAALDERGALLGTEGFATTMDGYSELFGWLSSFGKVAVVAVESTGCYAAGLVRYPRSRGCPRWRSTSPMRTPAGAWARATRSMPSWPRVGSENGHLVRRAHVVHRAVVAHGCAGVPFRERVASFPRRLYATAPRAVGGRP
jgi:hypothetical protein